MSLAFSATWVATASCIQAALKDMSGSAFTDVEGVGSFLGVKVGPVGQKYILNLIEC